MTSTKYHVLAFDLILPTSNVTKDGNEMTNYFLFIIRNVVEKHNRNTTVDLCWDFSTRRGWKPT